MAWIQGPRRQELATVVIDDAVPKGGVVVRDITGLAVSEIVTLPSPTWILRPAATWSDRHRDGAGRHVR